MSISEAIRQAVEAAFQPVHFELINESAQHRGHAGDNGTGESHFKLIIVSSVFESCGRIQRSRLVYSALDKAFSQGLHAISLELLTPGEYTKA